eukprot:TRINITY_DN11879_c0_g1_i1.p1 TRINITY_DN11879_c0_g1~~TRINITY_DN11879_c0_g1_i1.p1  ORF type:complete len:146 (-),score=26.37 TRINITY_DN11879_c0_g1_i1:289-726(-)
MLLCSDKMCTHKRRQGQWCRHHVCKTEACASRGVPQSHGYCEFCGVDRVCSLPSCQALRLKPALKYCNEHSCDGCFELFLPDPMEKADEEKAGNAPKKGAKKPRKKDRLCQNCKKEIEEERERARLKGTDWTAISRVGEALGDDS